MNRFLAGFEVYDTYNGLEGKITQMSLVATAVHLLAPAYTGEYFVVEYEDNSEQLFTIEGNRIDHVSGIALTGITLLNLKEKTAILAAGYPG